MSLLTEANKLHHNGAGGRARCGGGRAALCSPPKGIALHRSSWASWWRAVDKPKEHALDAALFETLADAGLDATRKLNAQGSNVRGWGVGGHR